MARGTRHRVLEPFLAALENAPASRSGGDPDEEVVSLRLGDSELNVDPWTHERLEHYFAPDTRRVAESARIVTQGVALLVKCGEDVPRLESQRRNNTGGLYALQAELMLNAAVGTSLVKDIQLIIDEMLNDGRVEDARYLSKFHHRVRNTVYDLRNRIDTDYRMTVDELAGQLEETGFWTADGVYRTATGNSAALPTTQLVTRAGRRRRAKRGRAPLPVPSQYEAPEQLPEKETGMPIVTLALAAMLLTTLLGLAAVRLPDDTAAPPHGGLTAERLSLGGTAQEVLDRWPSLFVTVDPTAWTRLGETERNAIVRNLSRRLSGERYTGVLIRSPEGRPLAEWIRTSGTRLLDRPVERITGEARRADAPPARTTKVRSSS